MKEYFLDNSNNTLTYTNIVTAYIRMAKPKSYYNQTSKDNGEQANELLRDAIALMKALPNYYSAILPTFSSLTVDGSNRVLACNVFFAGGNGGVWSQGLWPHSWWLENRQQAGRDEELPASGIAVWHIDELGDRDDQNLTPNTTHSNYEVTLVPADNLWHFQGNSNSGDSQDLFYSGNLAITEQGVNARDFAVTVNPASTVAPGGATTFTVRFTPEAPASRTVALHIASNDPDENPFILNLVEFAFGLHPKQNSAGLLPQPELIRGSLVLGFTEPTGAGGVSYGVESHPAARFLDRRPRHRVGTATPVQPARQHGAGLHALQDKPGSK